MYVIIYATIVGNWHTMVRKEYILFRDRTFIPSHFGLDYTPHKFGAQPLKLGLSGVVKLVE